ncbi:hypothetical protein EZV62_014308 [Acer yangbiense]|uniref:Uncharacterized protein n=1 Tax=Acer yangbiense TaxID=1000413 RepID=A0A5C7HSB3_9ROSI|nr:hypothetical protein EZV62_014308 [Acer yangbiense]
MGFGALRNIVRPLSRTLISRASSTPSSTTTMSSFLSSSSLFVKPDPRFISGGRQSPWIPTALNHFHSLTDTRFPKRRPVDKPHRKRASLRPRGPYAWVQYTKGQPISPNNPNEGSVKRRNEKKRMSQRCAFIKLVSSIDSFLILYLVSLDKDIGSDFRVSRSTFYSNLPATVMVDFQISPAEMSEAKKRKAQLQEANRKKRIKRVERKMAAVARERAWTVRLVELQQLEEEKKKSTA